MGRRARLGMYILSDELAFSKLAYGKWATASRDISICTVQFRDAGRLSGRIRQIDLKKEQRLVVGHERKVRNIEMRHAHRAEIVAHIEK